jgi:glycosyltransferase involved in cell wall biosynthesis
MFSKEGFQSRLAGYLKKMSNRLIPNGYYNLGADKLPANSPRALVIYTTHYLHKVLFKQPVDQSWLNSHSGFWESVELLRQLNEGGYIVDYFDTWNENLVIDWDRYDLVIDERDNLRHCTSSRPVKVFYCTGVYWLLQNTGELRRNLAFLQRTGLKTMAKRQLKPIMSDRYADLQTHFGADTQLKHFTPRYGFVPLNISCVTVPPKEIAHDWATARNHFVWFGGAGLLHKGADLAIEAFKEMPDAVLHLLGGIQEDDNLNQWLREIEARYANIRFEGWMNTESSRFQELMMQSSAVLLPSASEGGPTSVPQAMHFGLLPIVTTTANLRCSLGYIIDSEEPDAIIAGIKTAVRAVQVRSAAELATESAACVAFARENFTRDAYAQSVKALLKRVVEVRTERTSTPI